MPDILSSNLFNKLSIWCKTTYIAIKANNIIDLMW